MTRQRAGDFSPQDWPNSRRHAHYKVRSETSLRLLAGVGGLSVIGTGDLAGNNLNVWWAAVVVTLLLAAGGCLGMSWSTFGHGERVLKSAMDKDSTLKDSAWVKGDRYDPERGEALYRAGTILIALAGACLVIAFWWSAVATVA
ncbi:hypothetical protein EDD32_3475 [Georgenia muralis]|uniref:Uncharacterized protein n=1 Tax=Georgenia muralis TaxID=154117 RepID=A0A3N4ZA22_9MICO|nr:hypothetical protein EDD32_3475 [Georgenia muralis]